MPPNFTRFIIVCILFTSHCCYSQYEKNWEQDTCTNTPLNIPVFISSQNGSFKIDWEAIEEKKKGKRRPLKEIHCIVRDNTGIVGHYEGNDSILSHCAFSTDTPIVSVEFFIKYYQIGLDPRIQCRYKPVDVKLPTSEDNIINQTIQVQPDHDMFVFRCLEESYSAKRLNGLLLGPRASYINVKNYYLNVKKRRISTGDSWLRKLSFCTLKNRHGFVRIDPDYYYIDKKRNIYSGRELIKLKKIPLSFDLRSSQFRKDYNYRLYYKNKKGA